MKNLATLGQRRIRAGMQFNKIACSTLHTPGTDCLNIFAKKIGEKIGIFDTKLCKI
jgi:hypothetical protein